MLDRAQILKSGSLAPAVAPLVRIPPNGGEMNQFIAKQVLDIGVYGIVWPHVSTVEEARNAVQACRYPRPRSAPYYEPAGQRGDAPRNAARYWGIDQQTYYKRADTWPLNPEGEVLVVVMCEEKRAIRNLPQMLKEVPGIGVVLIRRATCRRMGYPRQYEHPGSPQRRRALAICKEAGVPCGHPMSLEQCQALVERLPLADAGAEPILRRRKGLNAAGRK
jgi:4-hydroxy-2-oxoheptanedioate aldolase